MDLPTQFIEYTRSLIGQNEWDKLRLSLTNERPSSIRLNSSKIDSYNISLKSIDQKKIPWCSTGYYLSKRLSFTFDPLFHSGIYYAQEASSMFLEQVIKQHITTANKLIALDLCAAPGGKSTLLRSLLPEGSLLIANEIMPKRAQILSENLQKWGHPDVIVTNGSADDFEQLPPLFDVVLADVPCSGEGMFRKDHGAIEEWSVENVNLCWKRQRDIIRKIWSALKPGGLLVYSTCTFNTLENEENVDWILQEFGGESLPVSYLPEWGVTEALCKTDQHSYRFFPHKMAGEGFFISAIRKPIDNGINAQIVFGREKKKKRKTAKEAINEQAFKPSENWIDNALKGYKIFQIKESLLAFPIVWMPYLKLLQQSKIRIIHAGVSVAYLKGKNCIPHHALAMSLIINKLAFDSVEVDYATALKYLRKEAITLPVMTSKGFVILKYRNIPLGFVKNIGNRSNNLYPNEWRIRSGYLPENIELL